MEQCKIEGRTTDFIMKWNQTKKIKLWKIIFQYELNIELEILHMLFFDFSRLISEITKIPISLDHMDSCSHFISIIHYKKLLSGMIWWCNRKLFTFVLVFWKLLISLLEKHPGKSIILKWIKLTNELVIFSAIVL